MIQTTPEGRHVTLRTNKNTAEDGKLARALKRRKSEGKEVTHFDRRRNRFEEDYRTICYDRFGKRDGFGLRRNTCHAA
jgi:hypothetical protein